MLSAGYDVFYTFSQLLLVAGFSHIKTLLPRSGQYAEVYAKDGRITVAHAAFRPRMATRAGIGGLLSSIANIQEEFEKHLACVCQAVEALKLSLRPSEMTIVFPGGGTLSLPPEFTDWAECLGVHIVIIPDSGPDAIERAMAELRL